MMREKILISHPLSPQRLESLNQQHDVDCVSSVENKYDETLQRIHDYDALFSINHQVDKAIMDRGKRLKLVSNYAVGYDNIDIEYAREKGIVVANIPNSTSAATAEYTLALILSLLRKIPLNDQLIKTNQLTDWSTSDHYGYSLKGKTLGILGMGRIGKIVAKMAQVFDMPVIYHNRNRLFDTHGDEYKSAYVTREELFRQSDIVSVNAPLTDQTYHIVNRQLLQLMKPTAYLINTARGNLINHDDLIEALEDEVIAGAALDVFPEEPIVPDALKRMGNVILSPHNGTGTHEDRAAMFDEAFNNILAFFDDREMTGRVV